MFNRRSLATFIFLVSLFASSLMCDVPGSSSESDQLQEEQDIASAAIEATRLSAAFTQTAQASITPTSTVLPTLTPTVLPTSTSIQQTSIPDHPYYTFDALNLPTAIFSVTDPSGDTYFCASGGSTDDAAVDILSINFYEPGSLGSSYQGWFMQVELGAPADVTFGEDWSVALLVAHAAPGASAYTLTLNEIHDSHLRLGTLDESGQSVIPDTSSTTFIDDQGNVWFVVPVDTTFLQVSSFHTPSEDLPPEQKRCDVAPNVDVYTVNLP